MGTDISDGIHLSAGRVQRLVALELIACRVGAAALAAGEGPAGAQRRAAALLLLVGRLALPRAPSPRQRPDCKHQLVSRHASSAILTGYHMRSILEKFQNVRNALII